jgi:hypothetical protein
MAFDMKPGHDEHYECRQRNANKCRAEWKRKWQQLSCQTKGDLLWSIKHALKS